MRIFLTVIVVAMIVFVISFSLQNASEISLKYYDLLDITLPSYMVMFMSFLVGVVFTGLMGLAERLRLTKTIRQLNKAVRDLRREIRNEETFIDDAVKKEDADNL